MKRVLLLGYILSFYGWSQAQIGFFTATNRDSKTAAAGEITASRSNPEPIAIPVGTHVLMKLISPLHTTSSTAGSGIYLETVFPVVHNDRALIPAHTRVLGEVEWERRPGRISGRAQMRLRFTQLILPDNRELPLAGRLQSLPGSSRNRTVDQEGMIEPVDQIDADVYTVVGPAAAGAVVGSVRHFGIGTGTGVLMGAGFGLAKVLFTRGDEISLPVGTQVEMVLQRPLLVQPMSVPASAESGDATHSSHSISEEHTIKQRAGTVPCLRDGVTLRCVTPETATVDPEQRVFER